MAGAIWPQISELLFKKFKIRRNPHNLNSFYACYLKNKSIEEITIWHNSKPNVLTESDLKTMIYISDKSKEDGENSKSTWTKLSQEYFPNIESNRLAKLYYSRKERNLLPKIDENEEIIPAVNNKMVNYTSRSLNDDLKLKIISLMESSEIYYEDAAEQLKIEKDKFILFYNSIRTNFYFICNYTHCIRRLDNKEEETKHQICHERKEIGKRLLEISLNYLEYKDNSEKIIKKLKEKYNESLDTSFLVYIVIDLNFDNLSLEEMIVSLFSSEAYFGQSNTILRKNEEFITGLISNLVNDESVFKNEKFISMKKPYLILIESELTEFLSCAFERAGINCGMRNLLNHQKNTMKKMVVDLTDDEQQQLKSIIPIIIIDKIIKKSSIYSINLEFLSKMVDYMFSPFVDSLKSIIPNYEHAKQKVGLPFRRLLSSIEINLKADPFISCSNCKTTILKIHKYCHNCGKKLD